MFDEIITTTFPGVEALHYRHKGRHVVGYRRDRIGVLVVPVAFPVAVVTGTPDGVSTVDKVSDIESFFRVVARAFGDGERVEDTVQKMLGEMAALDG